MKIIWKSTWQSLHDALAESEDAREAVRATAAARLETIVELEERIQKTKKALAGALADKAEIVATSLAQQAADQEEIKELKRKLGDAEETAMWLRQSEAQLEDRIAELSAPNPLDSEARQHLAAIWSQISCIHCGGAHEGVCNRVRKVVMNAAGGPDSFLYWDTWDHNPGVIWPDDVWDDPSARVKDLEEAARKRLEQASLERAAEIENRRRAESEGRRRSPREVLDDVVGGG